MQRGAEPVTARGAKRGWRTAASAALWSGTLASLFSAAALALCGLAERGTAAGPLNGPSQWVHGRIAAHLRGASVRHTLVGFAIHHLAAYGWAVVHERAFGRAERAAPAMALRNGAVTAALACFVDYRCTPKRLEPGFDAQLSKKSLLVVYAAFAVGLAASRFGKR